jgi:hypothetical protein
LAGVNNLTIVFVHGYSVSNFETYGGLPLRLRNEGAARGYNIKVQDIFLGRYITFNDEVRMDDVSIAFNTAVREQLNGAPVVCVTHSTGGPVVRNWWHQFYSSNSNSCPMTHLVMLAPPNHGSALAQLGKSRLSRMKSWLDGVEPGQNILDWLELGSDDACYLNKRYIRDGAAFIDRGLYPFVLTGQDIDRRLYDHINSYTGEAGSDGVVRVSSANLNSRYIKMEQSVELSATGDVVTSHLQLTEFSEAPRTPFRIIRGKSHSHAEMGIMKSVEPELTDEKSRETVDVIFECVAVKNKNDYSRLFEKFNSETAGVQQTSMIEEAFTPFRKYYIHDRYCMIIFRVSDSAGQLMNNFDLILTAGENDPDGLPPGFFGDRQCNLVNNSVIIYYLNYDVLKGTPALTGPAGETVRPALPGVTKLGLIIRPRPEEGFIHYIPCTLKASEDFFHKALQPNSTVIIDICLKRVVNSQVFRFEQTGETMLVKNFSDIRPGKDIVG